MRILDLYCGVGGAGWGFHLAGHQVTGVDIAPQPNYPFKFIQADVLKLDIRFLREFDIVHASPPCQAYSTMRHLSTHVHPQLIAPTRSMLIASQRLYVIENVYGSSLDSPFVLCGSMFNLGAHCRDGVWRQLRRHRYFETNITWMPDPPAHAHVGQPVGVYGTGGGGQMTRGYKSYPGEDAEALGIGWEATRAELAQAIPPAYTEWIGARV